MISPYLQRAGEYVIGYVSQYLGGGGADISDATPIPEIPAFLVPLSLFAALAASAWLLRKSDYNVPVLMK